MVAKKAEAPAPEQGELVEEGHGIDWEAAERAAIQGEGEAEAPAPQAPPEAAGEPEAPPQAPPEPEPAPPAAVTVRQEKLQSFKELLDRAMPRFQKIIPQHLPPERMFAVAYAAMARDPALMECSALSIIRGVLIGAQLGLDVSGVGGQAYLVPFNNKKTRQREAQFIAGYRGLIELAIRSRMVAWIAPGVVYQRDPEFAYSVNPIPAMVHKPHPDGPDADKELVGAYSVAVFRDRDVPPFPFVVSRAQVLKIRNASQAFGAGGGPWVTHEPQMWMKTAIRAHSKYLPSSPELNTAVDLEERAEMGEGSFPLPGELIGEVEDAASPNGQGGSQAAIARKLRGNPKP